MPAGRISFDDDVLTFTPVHSALMAPEDLTQLGFDNDHPPSIK